ncbi:small multidrug efflux protein [Microbacterium sp. A196]|uniref:small multidrug efflux protein n=1 Tax=Microbacterium sp. A196 TaxID=3457320 RepID=UPI003FD16922
MNPIEQLVRGFQDLVAYVPELVQPFVVMLAGAVPFVEGELAAMVGVVGGINPIIAGAAGAIGNFASVLLVVLITSRARTAVVDRRTARVMATAGAVSSAEAFAAEKPESKGRAKFKRWLTRFGVPGASILGPLAIPTQFTSAILVAGGTPRAWVLLWQAVAIAIWTTFGTVSVWAALTLLVGV